MSRLDRAVSEAAKAAAEIVGDHYKRREFTITRFARHRDGYFHAFVSIAGDRAYVHCRSGSWFLPIPNDDPASPRGREVISPYRDALAEKAREFEAIERKRRAAIPAGAAHSRPAQDAGGVHPPVRENPVPA